MSERPNIIWIVTTQWRAQAAGFAGDANARTPWLDGLASESVRFTQAVTPHPMGPQARAALLTGKPYPENGVRDYFDPLPSDVRTVADALRDRGYRTAFFGKWHLHERDRDAPLVGEVHARIAVPPGRRGGFEFWEGFESGFLLNDPWLHGTRLPEPTQFKGYQADVLMQRAADWCQAEAGRQIIDGSRYFCVVSLEAPHPPYRAPAPHVHPPEPASVTLRGNVPRGGDVEERARSDLAGYYAHIEATDRAIGKLLAEVDLTETTVVFTSVHGDMHGSHGLFRKGWPHEESIRVPLIVRPAFGRLPGGASAGDNSAPVSLVDLPHMTLAWSEVREWHCRRDSASISMPSATGMALQCPHAWHGFRSPRHKLIFRDDEASGSGIDGRSRKPWLYFDLKSDPLELNNLADDPARGGEIAELSRWL